MTFNSVLEIPEMNLIGDSIARKPQPKRRWPAGTRIISADSHWLEGDLWIDRYPEELKQHAPRMRFVEGGWELMVGGKPMIPPEAARNLCTFECVPGMSDVPERLRDLEVEGVEKELLFPQRLFGLYMFGDVDRRELVFGAYNEYMFDICAQAPGRLYFVGIPNYWNPSETKASIDELKHLGARCLMVPINPRKDFRGEPIHYASAQMEPFWAAVEEANVPLCFHIGENMPTGEPGAAATFTLMQMQGFRNTWGTLTFGGVFDRHPGLRIVFVEGGLSWIPGALHDADMIYSSFHSMMDPQLKHAPSHYWFEHCYATFMTDPAGLELLHRIGPDRVMWSSDYPHLESTLGYTSSAIQAVFDATSVENAQKILGLTALDLFRMD
jgi:predicted TIM-barrel fold metal-dependent hydrolase